MILTYDLKYRSFNDFMNLLLIPYCILAEQNGDHLSNAKTKQLPDLLLIKLV